MPQDLTNDNSILIQVMAWLSQCHHIVSLGHNELSNALVMADNKPVTSTNIHHDLWWYMALSGTNKLTHWSLVNSSDAYFVYFYH